MDNGTVSDFAEMETKIKCEMIFEEDIKTEIDENFAAEHEVYDLKVEECHPMDFATSIKIEDVTNSGNISDIYNIVDIKSLHNHESAANYVPSNESSVHTEHKNKRPTKKPRKSTDNKTSTGQRKRKRKKKEDITFACGFCAKTFTESKHFFMHMEIHDCSKNNRVTDNGSHLENTTPSVKTEITLANDSPINSTHGVFKCDECMKMFTMQHNLKRHKLLHRERSRPICDICKKSYNKKGYLVQHIKTVHLKAKSDMVFVCDVCHRTVNTAYALRCHMQIHTGKKPFECHLCGKGFSNKWNLKVHLKSH